MRIVEWIKANKVTVVLLVVFAYFVLNSGSGLIPLSKQSSSLQISQTLDSKGLSVPGRGGAEIRALPSVSEDIAVEPPVSGQEDRIVVKNSNLSLLVEDVNDIGNKIISYADNIGGYMVSASYNRPNESPFSTITVRVPSDNLDESLNFFRSSSIKVISENLVGRDVTDQYVDIEARISTLEKTKAKFESILDSAVEVQDILAVQREIINTQRQIDSLVGQRQSIEQNANLTKVTIFLSTDELALPYTPDEAFRPNVVFKQAVRSLFSSARSGANGLIWFGVYSVIWVPVLVILYIVKKRVKKKKYTDS
jgi:uncharacterized coiled-coil protein SlyX